MRGNLFRSGTSRHLARVVLGRILRSGRVFGTRIRRADPARRFDELERHGRYER